MYQGVNPGMKHHVVIQSLLIAILAFSLTACSGSGSFPGTETTVPTAAAPGNDAGVGGNSQGKVTIGLTTPSGGNRMETPDNSVILEGTAESGYEIVSVSWSSNRGTEGGTSGSAAWATTAIPLEPGDNEITITAEDSSGATGEHRVVITKESGTTGSVTLSWEAPMTRENGSTLADLKGYHIKYGRMSETYDYQIDIDNPGILTHVVEGLSSGEWYFVVRAYDSDGLESSLSDEVVQSLP